MNKVRINITWPKSKKVETKRMAKKEGLSFSGYLFRCHEFFKEALDRKKATGK